MTWAAFYLICFLVGLFLSLFALLAGNHHFHVRLDWHHGVPEIHGPHGGTAHGGPPVFNFGTLAAFLAWFGGTGYLLTEHSTLWFATALGLAVGSGVVGASLVFWFLATLMSREQSMDPVDYDMVGVLGRVSSEIRPGGVGEMIYSQDGARRSAAIRSEEGRAIPRDTEVVVTRFEEGIAYVRPWDELTAGRQN